jgi:deoxyribonuclease V
VLKRKFFNSKIPQKNMVELDEKQAELVKKYGIDLDKLEREQTAMAKQLEISDKIDFSLADKFGAIVNIFLQNKLLSCIIVCTKDYEVVDRAYSFEKAKFPYLPGFRSYRELPVMINAFDKLAEKPDVVFIPAQGITHPRLGLASHFGLATGVPTIGVSNSIVGCETKGDDILKDGKIIGKILVSKPGSNPMFISPGHLISVESAYNLSKGFINLPHKKPEPLHLASKYSRNVKKELAVATY